MHTVDTKALRRAMVDKNITTIEQLSRETGVNRNTLAGVLNGESYPSSSVMSRLVDGLGLDGEDAGRIFFASELA